MRPRHGLPLIIPTRALRDMDVAPGDKSSIAPGNSSFSFERPMAAAMHGIAPAC